MDQLTEIIERPEVKVLLDLIRISNTETYHHSLSVANIVNQMLDYTDYSNEEKKEILIGALLHDTGKIFIPFNLTQFPNSLSNPEYDIIKIHSCLSYEITHTVFSKMVQDICLYHHERPDGSGYVSKIKLIDIPPEALLVQIADIFDALISKRAYKEGYKIEEAIEKMRAEANQLKIDDYYLNILEKVLINNPICKKNE